MNDLAQAIFLGVVQGLTEFLPVSSSGHLVLAELALGDTFKFAEEAVIFNLVLHAGTLLPVLWFYRSDLLRIVQAFLPSNLGTAARAHVTDAAGVDHGTQAAQDRRIALYVVLATIPTGLIGVLFKDTFETLFHNAGAVCIALGVTGALLLSTRISHRDQAATDAVTRLTIGKALAIGLVQGLAITPGISRSGSTIAAALLLGIPREEAARFSFLLSIPAICGAIVLMLKDGVPTGVMSGSELLAGFTAALAVGYFALVALVALVKRGGLYRFTFYVWPLALVAWFYLA